MEFFHRWRPLPVIEGKSKHWQPYLIYIGSSLVSSKDSFQIYLKDISQLDLNTFEIYYRRFWEQKLMLC